MSERLDQPTEHRRKFRWRMRPAANPDFFGNFAESFARFMGTAKFILYMTIFVVVWVVVNLILSAVMGPGKNPFDPYPFILLNLAFSTQASYAAPLILLAQNRQDDRDRVTAEQDRQRAERNLADTEFLTREIASLRMAVAEVATRDFVRSEIRDLLDELDERYQRQDQASTAERDAKN